MFLTKAYFFDLKAHGFMLFCNFPGYSGDVWNPQPAPKDHPWRYMPNHAMTPHTSGTTIDGQVHKNDPYKMFSPVNACDITSSVPTIHTVNETCAVTLCCWYQGYA